MKAIIQKKVLYTLLTIALMGGFGIAVSPAYGVSILPVDTLIQQAYLRSQEDGFKSLTKSLSQGGDIYDSAYGLAKKNSLGSISEAFTSVAENLNTQYECSLTASDISNIVASDPIMNASFAGFAGKSTFSVDSEALVKSCVRVTQCVKGQEAKSAAQLANAYTQETYPFCRQTVQQAYNNTVELTAKQQTLDAANNGDDIFYNGSLDDSPYDLLLDMQLIGDILFKSNTAAPEIIFYDFPGNGNGGFTFFNPSGNGTNLAITNNGGGSSSNNNSFNNSANTNSSTNIVSVGGNTNTTPKISTSNSSAGVVNTQALQQLSAHHQNLQGGTKTNSVQAGVSSAGNTSASSTNGLVCVAPGQTTTTEPTPAQIAANQVTEATNLENALSTYNNAINAPAALHTALTSPEMQANNNTLNALANLGNPSANGQGSSNNSNNQDPNEAANSCVSKCNALAPADKAVCQAKCLCGTKYSNNGIFGISVCTVPTAQTEVIGGKTVKSVEEIVDEINAVLTALRNSGQLMKHTKTKEFLDTSLSKIKLNQILSFDMNIAFKPIYESQTNREKEQAKISQETANADRARQGTYAEGNVGQERNKYIVMSNPLRAQDAASDLADQPSPAPSTTIEPSLPHDLAKTLNNDMLNAVSNFMQQNAQLRQQVADTLNGINTTATNLEKKIQRAKN